MGNNARWKRVALGLGLALVYFGAAKWGLTLAFVQANATAVWPPTGIALAALLLGGRGLWPGIFLGAFTANLLTAGNLWTSLAIASGNTLEALLGCFLVERFAKGRESLRRTPDLFRFVLLGGLLAPVVSASVGVSTLQLAGMTAPGSFKDVWLTWWLGDVGGALLVAPLLLLWPGREFLRMRALRLLEGIGLAIFTFLVLWLLFGGTTALSFRNDPVQFLFIPIFIWAASRFGPFGASLTLLSVSIFAIQGTLLGFGPFQGATENQSLLFLQGFMSMTAVAILALACGAEERRKDEEALRWSHSDLQLKVLERTEHLVLANKELEKQFKEKEGLAGELMESNEKFHLLSEATDEGVVLVVEGVIVGANSSFCGIFGFEPGEVIGMRPDQFVVQEDRETVREHVRTGYGGTYPVRGLRKDGTRIDLEVTGRTVRQKGEAVRVTAIRDVTERNRREEELRKLALLVETSSDFICLAALDGHMTYLNSAGRRLVGLEEREDISGKLHQDFVAPEDVPRLMGEVIATLLSKGHWEGEFHLRHFRTGAALPFHFTAVLVRDPSTGEPRALAGIGRDLVEIKRKDEELERMALFVENVEDYAILFLDTQGRVESWNAGAQRITGHEEAGIVGKHFSAFYSQQDIEEGKPGKLLEEARRAGRVADVGWRVRKDGSRFWADVLLTALRDGKGRLRGFAKITRDVTQRKRMEELTRSNQDLEQFAYVASHDLQEPLRMVTSFVQLLARKYQGKIDPEADRYIHEIVEGAGRMRTLILDLLAYSRVSSSADSFGRVDCGEVLGQALHNLEALLREAGAEVSVGDLPTVKGDPHQIAQLFQNLLGNAIKFRGPAPLKVRVEALARNGDWVFCVRDNGIGIDPKYAQQIFEVFKRLHSRSEYPGTGIGLAICKKVVGRHGGRIWVESGLGQGATFYWTLPVLEEAELGNKG